MDMIVIIVVGVVEVLIVAVAMFFYLKKNKSSGSGSAVATLQSRLRLVEEMKEKIEGFYDQMTELPGVAARVKEVRVVQEAVKAERGRITITQAELETIETRLRELEEIERELEASGIETKEELNILKKKERDLATKNDSLKSQIAASTSQLDMLLGQIEASAQVKEQVQNMKTQMIQTEQKITELLIQVEEGNEQYFVLKQRYDALDIEYAQLYEKFSEAEAMMGAGKEKKDD